MNFRVAKFESGFEYIRRPTKFVSLKTNKTWTIRIKIHEYHAECTNRGNYLPSEIRIKYCPRRKQNIPRISIDSANIQPIDIFINVK